MTSTRTILLLSLALANSAVATNKVLVAADYLWPTSGWTGKAWMSNASDRFAFDASNLVGFSELAAYRDTYTITNAPTPTNSEIIYMTNWVAYALPYPNMTNDIEWWLPSTNRTVYQGVGVSNAWHMTNVAYGATRTLVDLTNTVTIGKDNPLFQMRDVWGRDAFYACKERSSTNDIEFELDNEDDFMAPLVYFYKHERDNLVRVKAWIANSIDRCAWVDTVRWKNDIASTGIPAIDTNGWPAQYRYTLALTSLLTRANLPTNYLDYTPYSQLNGVGTPSTNEYTYGAFTTLDYGYWGISNIFKQMVWVFTPSTVSSTNNYGGGYNESNNPTQAVANALAMFQTNSSPYYGSKYWDINNYPASTNYWYAGVLAYGEWQYTLNKFKPAGLLDYYVTTDAVGVFDAQGETGVVYSPSNFYLLYGDVNTFDGYNGTVSNVYGNLDVPPNQPTPTPLEFKSLGFYHNNSVLILKFDNADGFKYR